MATPYRKLIPLEKRRIQNSFLIFLLFISIPTTGFARSGTIEQFGYLSSLENAVVHEINMARKNPKDYASFLVKWKRYYNGKLLKIPGETTLMTEEGVTAVTEAIGSLRSTNPASRLNPSKGMSSGARDHVTDQGSSGRTQHKGSDGSQPWDRVNRYGTWEKSIAENIAYGSDKARNIVMHLIIDDGVSSRGHRKNIFNPDFQVIGVACGHHPTYRTVCVITFAGGYKEKSGK